MWKVPLFELNYDTRESKAVLDVLNSQWLTMGEQTINFEKQFSLMLNHPDVQCVFVSNCTAALYMSVLALGLEKGDEVIIPSLTFVADLNATIMAGAKPVLADCHSLDDWNISAESIEKCITPKTKAVMVVHYAGYPCDMDPIVELCKKHKLFLIEDVAHAPGATYKGKACGTIGDIGCFSFFSNKNISMGEGGMLSTCNPELFQTLKYLRSHGMSSLTLDRHKGRTISYDVIRTGLNFRSDEIHAALGLVQLDKLEQANLHRRDLTDYYRLKLRAVKGIDMPFTHTNNTVPSYHVLPVLLDKGIDRIDLITKLKEAGIQSSIHYPSFHQFSAFKSLNLNPAPIADQISERELTLPLYPGLSFDLVDLVVSTIDSSLKKVSI
jgi:dTDP-4-amino-4,6-dideoxygalactose transaminase